MVNLSRRFKLEYEDASTGTTIIAETGQDTGAPKIDRHIHIRKTNDPDILKLWLEDPDYGNTIPTDKSNFATAQNSTDDPEILYKQYDIDTGSFVTQGRFYAKNSGTINEEGELAVKLYSFMKYHAKDEVDFSDSTDIESAMNQALPTGYVADVPVSSTSINGTYSSDGRREQAFQELTRNYNYALTFTSELDGNNDYKVKFEPIGQGGTVDTLVDRNQTGRYPIIDVDTTNDVFVVAGDKTQELVVNQVIEVDGSTGNDGTYTISALNYDSSNNETDITVSENISDSTADGSVLPGGNMKIKHWEKDKTDSVVNRVTVKGVNSQTGNSISQTAENTDLQNKVGVKKRPPIKIGYLNAASDADAESDALEAAQSFLVPSQGVTELPESGRVKTAVYSDNVVNDSFQVVSNQWNIDDTYKCVQQRNFWPEGASELEFEFEQEGLERAAQGEEDLRDERARLLPSSTTDVGNQTVDADTEDVTDQYDAHASAAGQHDVAGQSYTETTDDTETNEGVTTFNNLGDGITGILTINTDFVNGETDVTFLSVQVTVENNSSTPDGYDLEIVNTDTGTQYFNENNFIEGDAFPINGLITASTQVVSQENLEGDSIDFKVTNNKGGDRAVQISASVCQLSEFTINQPEQFNGAEAEADGSTNDTNPSDSSAGDTTSLNATGSTEDNVNVNTATEDKTNR